MSTPNDLPDFDYKLPASSNPNRNRLKLRKMLLICTLVQLVFIEFIKSPTFDVLDGLALSNTVKFFEPKDASDFALSSKEHRNIMLHANQGLSLHQYHLIKKLILARKNAAEEAPMPLEELYLVREFFKSAAKTKNGKQKMTTRIRKAIPDLAYQDAFFKAVRTNDVYKIKVLLDYFDFNTASNWNYIKNYAFGTNDHLPLRIFFQNSVRYLDMQRQNVPVDEFIAYFQKVLDNSSLNIVHVKFGTGEKIFLLNKFTDLNANEMALFDFLLSLDSVDFDTNAPVQIPDRSTIRFIKSLHVGSRNDFLIARKLISLPSIDINKFIARKFYTWPDHLAMRSDRNLLHTPLMELLRVCDINAIQFLLSQPDIDLYVEDVKQRNALFRLLILFWPAHSKY